MKQFLVLCLLLVLTCPVFVLAQLGVPQQNITLATIPRLPEPLTETTVRLEAYTIDTTGAAITWFVDGIEQVDARNEREIKFTTKSLGDPTTIRVRLSLRTGQTLSHTIYVRPARIDLVLEADTLTPALYPGRALPTIGSQVRVIATPHTGQNTNPEDFSYLWKHDNQIMFGGPVKGKYVAEIEMGLGREQIITVDAIDKNGTNVARKSLVVPISEPEILFYEDNPLRGVSGQAAVSPFVLVGDETTLRAEPYYMDKQIFNGNHLVEWSLNNIKIINSGEDPQAITLRRNDNVGQAVLGFHVRNLDQLLQGIESQIVIDF